MAAEVVALLRDVLLELRQLRVDLAEQRSAGDVRLDMFLRAVHAALGNAPFTAGEVVELAARPLSTRVSLKQAVSNIVGDKEARRSLGHFLAANVDSTVGALRLVSVRGSVYRIETVETRPAQHWPVFTKGRT